MNKFKAWLRDKDSFGKPVGLLLNGQETFKSAYGGAITLIGRAVLIYYLITSLIKLSKLDKS